MRIAKGDRIVILGLNGSGKSVFIRHLMNVYTESKKDAFGGLPSDNVYFNPRIVVGYVDQELSILPPQETLQEFIQKRFGYDKTKAIRELVYAGFSVNEQDLKIQKLSFGQKARLAFLVLKNEQPNFYIMDEPTNHLDIDGQERLERAIVENDNPCVFVSHDRRLISDVATKFFLIEKNKLRQIDSPEPFYQQAFWDSDACMPSKTAQSITKKKLYKYTGQERS